MSGRFLSASGEYIEGTDSVYNGAIRKVNGCTLTGWIYPTSISYSATIFWVISTNYWSNPRAYLAINQDGSAEATGRCADGDSNQACISSAGVISTGHHYHVAGLFDFTNKTINLYVNGSNVKSVSGLSWSNAPTSDTDSTLTMIGGYTAGTHWFDGYIEDCRSYNRLLSVNEVVSMYNSFGRDSILYGLQNRYRLMGGNGVTINPEYDLAYRQYSLTRASGTRPKYSEDHNFVKTGRSATV